MRSIACLKVQGTPGELHTSNDLTKLLNVTDKIAQTKGDQYISSELFLLAAYEDRALLARLLKDAGFARGAVEKAVDDVRGGERVQDANAEESRQALEKYTHRSHQARDRRQTRPGHRSRRRDSTHDPGAAAPHQK
jgi:ATP-dependent Clp protease ATP-binding subunit ClpA